MEVLIIFIIIAFLEKVFKSKKDQKNIQEARKKRMEDLEPTETKSESKTQDRSYNKKTKNIAEKIREEIEKGYDEFEKQLRPDTKSEVKPIESRKIDEKSIMEKTRKAKSKDRYITDYDEPYETYNGKGTLLGGEYKGRYSSEYDKPYETHGRKTGSQEGKTYKKTDEEFYRRREKMIPIVDKESKISIQNQILTGIIYSEILGKPKSLKKR